MATLVPHRAASVSAARSGSVGFADRLFGFEPNRGQGAPGSDFVARSGSYSASIGAGSAVLTLRDSPGHSAGMVRLSVLGAASTAQAEGIDKLPGVVNELVGNDPSLWLRGVPTFSSVEYASILPGVDLLFHSGTQFEYDFVVAPGTDPSTIELHADGADAVRVDSHGDLLLRTEARSLVQHQPVIYQDIDGHRQAVAGRYVLAGRDNIRIDVGAYDTAHPLVIDPVVTFSSQVPGGGPSANAVAVDAGGNSYVTGTLTSPAASPRLGAAGGSDAFVAKLGPDGTTVFLTVLGGSGDESGDGVAVDGAGRAVLTGETRSTDFPTTASAFTAAHACPAFCTNGTPNWTAFVSVFDAAGQRLVYSTYFGGTGPDSGVAVALDRSGGVYVAGESGSNSINFATKNAYHPAPCDCGYKFGWAAKFDVAAAGDASLVYSTLIMRPEVSKTTGGTFVLGVAVDTAGSAYVVGQSGGGYPTTPGAFDTVDTQAAYDGFVTKLSPDGRSLVYSTRLGPPGMGTALDPSFAGGEAVYAAAVDARGDAYVTGQTGPNFPTAGSPLQAQPKGKQDAFVTELDPTGSVLVYSTYLGGSGDDVGRAIAVDAAGRVLVGGNTGSSDFPAVNPISGQTGTGGFLTEFDFKSQVPVLRYSTTLAGSGVSGVAFGPSGSAYVSRDGGLVLEVSTLPVVTSLSETAGPTAGGTSITVSGSGLSGAKSLAFGTDTLPCGPAQACQPDPDHADTTLHVTSGAHLPGTVDLRVTTADGTSAQVAADRFTYRPPVVSAIDVITGPATGGTVVHLAGTDLQGSTVQFGSSSASGVTPAADGTSVVATTPPNRSGAMPVVVSTPAGATATAPSTYTYMPAITGMVPPSGSLAGGDSIVILGAGLSGATDVRFGADSAGAPIVAPGRDDQLVVPAIPAHAKPETVAVTVSAQGLDSVAVPSGANMFSYTNPPPPAKAGDVGPAAAAGRQSGTPSSPAPPQSGTGTGANPGAANNTPSAPAQAASPTPAQANVPAGGGSAIPSGAGGQAPAASPAAPSAPVAASPAPVSAAQGAAPAPASTAPAPVAGPGPAPAPGVVAAPGSSAPSAAAQPGSTGPAAPAADPAGPSRGAPGYAMVGRTSAGSPPGMALFGVASGLTFAFGCLVLAERRRDAAHDVKAAFAGLRYSRRP